MLSLAEYRAVSAQIKQLGKEIEEETLKRIEGLSKQEAIQVAKDLSQEYQKRYINILSNGLREVAANAATYYNDRVEPHLTQAQLEELITKIVKTQLNENYYGATLEQRLKYNYKRLNSNIIKSAAVDTEKLASVYTQKFPFGAHSNIDNRLLQATAVKIEQDLAVEFAEKADYPLIKWTLSGRHAQPDICDDYAAAVDDKVVKYLQDNDIDEDARGLYFKDSLPLPPHPNCGCEYSFVGANKRSKRGPIKRTIQRVRSLIRRIRAKI